MSGFARLVALRARLVLALALGLTAVALHGIVDLRTGELRIRVDPALDRLLPEGDDERRFYDRALQLFGGDEFVLLAVEADDVFAPEILAALQRITGRLEGDADVSRVLSIANAVHAEGREGELFVGAFFDEVPREVEALEDLRAKILSHPLYGGSLVARDGRAAAILVFTEGVSDADFVRQDLGGRFATLAREEARSLEVTVTGQPHIKARLSRTIVSELSFILPGVLGISALLCWIAFRSARGVLLPLATIALALVWTLGAMGWSGVALNLVSNIIPPLIITLGFASAMHVVAEYAELISHVGAADREANRGIVEQLVRKLGLTIAMNGLTTMLGFAALGVSPVLAIREFGLWAVVGVFSSTLAALTFLPAMLVLLGPAKRSRSRTQGRRFDILAAGLARFDLQNRTRVLAASVGLLLVALFGMSRIHVSTGFVSNFAERSDVRRSFAEVNDLLGGVNTLSVVVEADEDDAFTRSDNLRVLRDLQDWLEAQPEISGTASLADGVMLLHQAFADGDPGAFVIPDRQRMVKQLLLLGGDDVRRGFVDGEGRAARIAVRTTVEESAEVAALLARIEQQFTALPLRLEARATGGLVLLSRTMDDIVRGQLRSIGLALVTIYLALSVLLTSFRVGLYALLPNLLPIAVYYGTLGILGIPLNLSTSLIGVIALGIAVDDTVHYFARFAREARRTGDEHRATVATLIGLARPITFTTIGLCLGFLVLTFSELQNQVQFGLLSAFTIAVAWVLDVTLSPAICSGVRIVTLWDLLSLDLGPSPQRSIPLFAGLSERQARVVALMADLVTVPAGQRLFKEGETGQHLYVVIEGELMASLARDEGRVEFSRMRRGDIAGEISIFGQARSADVDVVTDARLLRIGEESLERLLRRYPRIAAHVHRNLGRIVATRVSSTIQALR